MKEKATSLTRWSASLLLLAAGLANAAPVPSGLSIQASVSLDTLNSLLAEGGATQSGSISLVSGGAPQSAIYGDDPAAIAPSNNLSDALTETGDGLFATAQMSGAGDGAATPRLLIDFSIDFTNGSATDSFEVFLRFGRLHTVSAVGLDAYAFSEFIVSDGDSNELFVTDYNVDTLFPDNNDLFDAGDTSFSVVLAPGETFFLSALLDQEGGAFASDSSYSADLIVDMELVRVAVLSDPPQPVPLPGTLPLLGLGLALLATRRRRTAYQPSR